MSHTRMTTSAFSLFEFSPLLVFEFDFLSVCVCVGGGWGGGGGGHLFFFSKKLF